MQATRSLAAPKKNLLLCFDAFGTLFTPNVPIGVAYAEAATRHGISCGDTKEAREVWLNFKKSWKSESKSNPNYGKATGMGAEKWWGNVIHNTFTPFLKPDQKVPPALITDLLRTYSTKEGYDLYPDVLDFLEWLNHRKNSQSKEINTAWPFQKTVVGIITNSDDRVPGILRSFGLKVNAEQATYSQKRHYDNSITNHIDFVTLSYDVGHEKPDRRIFDAATSKLTEMLAGIKQGPSAEDFEKLHVGDDLSHDYEGARAAGWDAIMLDRLSEISNGDTGLKVRMMTQEDDPLRTQKTLVAKSLNDVRDWRPITFGKKITLASAA